MLWHGVVTDISAQKQVEADAREAARRWQVAVDAAELGLVSVDLGTQRIELDARACAHHRWPETPGWLTLPAWLELFDFEAAHRASLVAQMGAIEPGQTLTLSCNLAAAGPLEARRIELIAQAFEAEGTGLHRLIGTSRDVTGQLQVERLRSEKQAAESASHEKSQFLSRVSHELRTPLNAILGFNQLLQSDHADPLTARQHGHLRHVKDAGHLLLGLINDMLDLGRIEQGLRTLDSQPVDSQALLATCTAMLAQMAHDASVHIQVQVHGQAPTLSADLRALEQVLLNLLSNGIKYNRRGGTLHVDLQRERGHGCITVRDEGAGLSADQVEQLFQPFNRLGAETSGVQGSGLGLVIARQLVDAMGGTLRARSTPGEGATFTVTLPLHAPVPAGAPAVAPAQAARLAAAPRAAVTLLYVEDDPVNALLMQEALRMRPDWHLVVAPDAAAALALLRAQPPALVMTDINLPGLSGLELVRHVRTDPSLKHVPRAMAQWLERASPAPIETPPDDARQTFPQ